MARALAALFLSAVLSASAAAAADGKYKTYREAYSAGAKEVNAGNLAAAREPLEAAAELAKTDREKLEARRALLIPYRELQEIEPMQKAAEFIITHSTRAPERSLTRTELLTFIQKRGKMDEAAKAYEARLKEDGDDETVLYVLSEIYATFKKDPARAAELGAKSVATAKQAGKPADISDQAKTADQLVKSGKLKEGAELFERVAPGDPKREAWHLKEAAQAWLKAGETAKAVAAARKSAKAAPETRSELLTYFWHRALGDVLLAGGEPKEAIPQYEKALAVVTIEGYEKDTKAKLAEAKAAAGK